MAGVIVGFSVASGNFFPNKQAETYVAGAPRSQTTGEVIFFERSKGSNGQLDSQMKILSRLKGETFASGFGYELAAADINGDGFVHSGFLHPRLSYLPPTNAISIELP